MTILGSEYWICPQLVDQNDAFLTLKVEVSVNTWDNSQVRQKFQEHPGSLL